MKERGNPLAAQYYNELGLALGVQLGTDEAIAAFEQAVALRPDYAEAYNNMGACLRRRGKLNEAVAAYRQALAHRPDFAVAHFNLANALRDQRLFDESIASYHRAIKLQPDFAQAYSNLGVALKDTGQLEKSIAVTRRALEIKPDLIAASNLLCTLHYRDGCDPNQLFEEHQRWNQVYARQHFPSIRPHSNDLSPGRRLRIGYVSPDLSGHPIGRCLLPILAHHDHAGFEIVCYSDVRQPDIVTRRLQSHAAVWRDSAQLSDEQLANQIRDDRIDILVDLAVHTNENRLPVFARKPAPVQVTWLGLPTTTGLETMDYRLSDPYLDPPDRGQWPYSEKTIRLPDCFWPYGTLSDQPPVNELSASRNGFVTFGCFNNFCKVNQRTLDLWAQVMTRTPGSRMLVLAPQGNTRERLADRLRSGGVESVRVEFIDRLPHPQYLELYHRIDICLDTVPFGGHTTSIDSFWMGVPIISIAGELPVWRAGLSIASNLGLAELVADSDRKYVELAAQLAADLPRLAPLRQTLRARTQASPIMKASQFARDLEKIFRDVWRTWCNGQNRNPSITR